MDVAERIGLLEQLVVDTILLRHLQVVGNANHDDPVLQCLALAVGNKCRVFVLVGMREDRFIRVDQSESTSLDVLFLAEGQQAVQKLLIDLQHLDEFHQSAVRDIQFAVEPVSAWIRFDSDLPNGREVDRARQLGNVL